MFINENYSFKRMFSNLLQFLFQNIFNSFPLIYLDIINYVILVIIIRAF